jgi:hypothetical protein
MLLVYETSERISVGISKVMHKLVYCVLNASLYHALNFTLDLYLVLI